MTIQSDAHTLTLQALVLHLDFTNSHHCVMTPGCFIFLMTKAPQSSDETTFKMDLHQIALVNIGSLNMSGFLLHQFFHVKMAAVKKLPHSVDRY